MLGKKHEKEIKYTIETINIQTHINVKQKDDINKVEKKEIKLRFTINIFIRLIS